MPVTYELAPEVRTVAQRVIDKSHPHLRATRIEYVFRSKANKHNGRPVAGTAKKVTGVNALLATPKAHSSEDLEFFLITIAKDIWETLTPQKKTALVDHELCHCRINVDEEGFATLALRGHDIEEFGEIVQRHGLWSDDLEWFVTTIPAEQMDLLAGTAGSLTDIPMTLSYQGPDGTEESVDTSTGEISAAANLLRNGSGIVDSARAQRIAAGEENPGKMGLRDGEEPF